MTRYPPLSPPPTIEWGPGSAKIGSSMWFPADVALQLQGPYATDGDSIASLALYAVEAMTPDHAPDIGPKVSIELTAGDCRLLIEKLQAFLSWMDAQ